jgi:hypothetical protein
MLLREIAIINLRTGDRVLSHRGRPGRVLMMNDIGVTQHIYLILWSMDGVWESEKQLISVDANLHGMDGEYPVTEKDVKYLGRA